MSRNGSGTYTLPSGNPVVSGTLIEASWANTTLSDLASAMTDSLSRSGQGGMTAALRLFDGTSSVPGLAWGSETTTGWYRAGAGDMRLVITGSQVIQYLSTGVAVTGTLSVSGNTTLSGGTANGVAYLNGSKVLTTGSALTFDGSKLGVGNANPATAIEVSGDMTIRKDGGALYFRNTGATAYPAYITATDSTAFTLSSNQNIPMVFKVNDTEQMRLTSTGLGIGTSSPGTKLHVSGSANYVAGIESSNTFALLGFKASGSGGTMADPNVAVGATGDALYMRAGGAERARLDASGNLGLGVTPSAWGSIFKSIDISGTAVSGTSGGALVQSGNAVFNGSSWVYKVNGPATRVELNAGTAGATWHLAGSGTAGNAISFTQAMTLSNSGNNTALVLQNPAASQTTTFSTSDLYYDFSAAGAVVWRNRTGNAESARIDSSGNLLVGTTSYPSATVAGTGISAALPIRTSTGTFTGAGDHIQFYNGNGSVGYIRTNGTATSYVTSSDYRLKNTIAPMTGALAKVAQLKPCTYKWNVDGSDGEGFIAHELQAVCPDAVTGEKDAVDAEGKPQYQGIDTSFLVATLTAAIQEQQALINSLKADVAALKGA